MERGERERGKSWEEKERGEGGGANAGMDHVLLCAPSASQSANNGRVSTSG